MNRVVKILMDRDGLDENEAYSRVREVREQFEEVEYDALECEQILMDEIGLELDYIFDII